MKKGITVLFFAALLLVACKSSKNASSTNKNATLDSSSNVTTIESWIVSNTKVSCTEGAVDQCLQIKKGSNSTYEILNSEIVGFNYEPGYKYQLEVKIANNKKTGMVYSLVKELYKIPMK